MDTLHVDSWYSISKTDVLQHAGGRGILKYYKGSLIKALIDNYPEINLKKEKFKESNLKQITNQNSFFDDFAKSKNFNPQDLLNWYSVTIQDILQAGGADILSLHQGSLKRALSQQYSELNFKIEKFLKYRDQKWKISADRRKFFDRLAKSRNFDSLVSYRWYSINYQDVVKEKGGSGVLSYHNGSHVQALIDLYPDLELQPQNFSNYKENSALSLSKH